MADNKVSEMIAEAAKNFEVMINANAVVGEAMQMGDGTIIVPVSKLSFGFGGGGSEFEAKKHSDQRFGEPLFGGGIGGGASVKAEAFLVINSGNVRLIPMNGGSTPMDKLIDLMPSVIDKVNGFITSRSDKKAEKTAGEAAYDNNEG